LEAKTISGKFGDDYVATEHTYTLGIDQRFTKHMAERFANRRVLETCTGAGFTTIALARVAAHVVTVEIDPNHQAQARQNLERAGLLDQVTFVAGDALTVCAQGTSLPIDAAFLDPDWAVHGPDHIYRFLRSNMRPPADQLLEAVFGLTNDIALVLPPLVDVGELIGLPEHERQRLYFGETHEIYCLYFGALARSVGVTELRL
jgi:SAM-dependent methyltransferase